MSGLEWGQTPEQRFAAFTLRRYCFGLRLSIVQTDARTPTLILILIPVLFLTLTLTLIVTLILILTLNPTLNLIINLTPILTLALILILIGYTVSADHSLPRHQVLQSHLIQHHLPHTAGRGYVWCGGGGTRQYRYDMGRESFSTLQLRLPCHHTVDA